jgi:hypothetical protein
MRKIAVKDINKLFENAPEKLKGLPVHVQEDGEDVAVILSPARYQELLMRGVPDGVQPVVVELFDEEIKRRASLYEALAKLG